MSTPVVDPKGGYQYQPLNAGDIRILTLQPSPTLESGFELTISHISLQTKGYRALSYTWGDASDQSAISLNGHDFCVNTNLLEALKAITSQFDCPSMLWVDAICINQNDLDERAEQVKIMRDLYANAEFVIAWIGKREEDDELGYMMLDGISERVRKDEPNTLSAQGPLGRFSDATMGWLMQGLENNTMERCWKALTRILNRPWWSRAWIVQEVAVSDKAYLMCGSLLADFSDVFVACALIYTYEGQAMSNWGGTTDRSQLRPGKAIMKFPNLGGGARKAVMLSTEHAYQKYRSLIGRTASKEEFQAKSGLPVSTFSEIIWRFSNKLSTDPRDKIYAYMGLAMSQEIIHIQINYEIEVPKLYRQVVLAHLETHKNLKILEWLSGVDRPNEFSSWAHPITPGTTPGPEIYEVKELQIKWNAALGSPAQFHCIGDNEDSLSLQGLYFDTIEAVGEEFCDPEVVGKEATSSSNSTQSPHNVYKAWQAVAGIRSSMKSVTEISEESQQPKNDNEAVSVWKEASSSSGNYPTGQSSLDAFVQTIVMDTHKVGEYSDVFVDRAPILVANRRPNPFLPLIAGETLSHRRFFVTAKGYYGLGPNTVLCGDKISVLFGAATPYVLREQGDHHFVVGWCYIQGAMRGEAIHQMNNGELEKENILLR